MKEYTVKIEYKTYKEIKVKARDAEEAEIQAWKEEMNEKYDKQLILNAERTKTETKEEKKMTDERRENEKKYLNKYIQIIHMKDEGREYDGKTGKVTRVDDRGQLHGTWGALAVIPEEDEFKLL